MEKAKIKVLAECGILIALAAVLSLIKIWQLPWGGSVTLFSMLPIALISIRHGVKTGLFSAFVYAVIQLVFGILFDGLLGWGLTAGALISCILLDYIIAFTVLGLSGLFADKGMGGVIGGTVLAVCALFLMCLAACLSLLRPESFGMALRPPTAGCTASFTTAAICCLN